MSIRPSLRNRVDRLERRRTAAGEHAPETLAELVLASLRNWQALPPTPDERARFDAMHAAAASEYRIPPGRLGWLAQLILAARPTPGAGAAQ